MNFNGELWKQSHEQEFEHERKSERLHEHERQLAREHVKRVMWITDSFLTPVQ